MIKYNCYNWKHMYCYLLWWNIVEFHTKTIYIENPLKNKDWTNKKVYWLSLDIVDKYKNNFICNKIKWVINSIKGENQNYINYYK